MMVAILPLPSRKTPTAFSRSRRRSQEPALAAELLEVSLPKYPRIRLNCPPRPASTICIDRTQLVETHQMPRQPPRCRRLSTTQATGRSCTLPKASNSARTCFLRASSSAHSSSISRPFSRSRAILRRGTLATACLQGPSSR